MILDNLFYTYYFFFRYEATSDNLNITAQCTGDYGFLNSTGGFSRFSRMEQLLIQPKRSVIITPAGPTTGIKSHNLGKEMKRSAFRVFSALAASDEDIRKKVILKNTDIFGLKVKILVVLNGIVPSR